MKIQTRVKARGIGTSPSASGGDDQITDNHNQTLSKPRRRAAR